METGDHRTGRWDDYHAVSGAGTTIGSGKAAVIHLTGFQGTPTIDAAGSVTNNSTTNVATMTLNASTNFNNSIMLVSSWDTQATSAYPANFQAFHNSTIDDSSFWQILYNNPGANNFSAPLSPNGQFLITNVTLYDAPAGSLLADGTAASGTTVATGTGGLGMSAVSLGQLIHVLLMASTSNSGDILSVTDSLGNTYVADSSGHYEATDSRQFLQAHTIVTTAGTPVITGSKTGSAVPMWIAAAVVQPAYLPLTINTITPYSGFQANNRQTAASIGSSPAPNSQTSGAMAALATPSLLSAWGFCAAGTSPPTPSSGWTAGGNLLGALTSGRLTYEFIANGLYGTAYSATFTPVPSQEAYTFVSAFNLNPPFTPFTQMNYVVVDKYIQR